MSLRNAAVAAVALSLTGCASMRDVAERHPAVTGFVAASLVLSAGDALKHHSSDADRHIPTPSVDCSTGGCK